MADRIQNNDIVRVLSGKYQGRVGLAYCVHPSFDVCRVYLFTDGDRISRPYPLDRLELVDRQPGEEDS